MAMLDEIKKELGALELPWGLAGSLLLVDRDSEPVMAYTKNKQFIAAAPERIAALVEYVEAAEVYFTVVPTSSRSVEERIVAINRVDRARAKIGLAEKEAGR